MDSVHFLNLEYFLLLVYRIFTGSDVDISEIPQQTLTLMTYVGWTGVVLAVLFGAGAFYLRRRMFLVEHAGWHERRQEEEKFSNRDSHAALNPQWKHVLQLVSSPTQSDWRRAILEADIMLDQMLLTHGYSGTSVGDKLKTANPLQFNTLDLAWSAHKMRNDVAHQGERFLLTERDARAAIDMYRRVFEEFNYI